MFFLKWNFYFQPNNAYVLACLTLKCLCAQNNNLNVSFLLTAASVSFKKLPLTRSTVRHLYLDNSKKATDCFT